MSSDFDINLAMFPLLPNRPVREYIILKLAVEGTPVHCGAPIESD